MGNSVAYSRAKVLPISAVTLRIVTTKFIWHEEQD